MTAPVVLDDFGGLLEHGLGDRRPEGLRGLGVDDEVEEGRPLDGCSWYVAASAAEVLPLPASAGATE
jgi:hypothetical protein